MTFIGGKKRSPRRKSPKRKSLKRKSPRRKSMTHAQLVRRHQQNMKELNNSNRKYRFTATFTSQKPTPYKGQSYVLHRYEPADKWGVAQWIWKTYD